MYLGMDNIISMIKHGVEIVNEEGQTETRPLIENYDLKQLEKPEGCLWDVRLDDVYILKSPTPDNVQLFTESRRTAASQKMEPNKKNIYTLHPGIPFLVTTYEKVNTPKNLIIEVERRTTMFRSGINLEVGKVNPGYCGFLSFGLIVFLNKPIKIQRGFRIASLSFHPIIGESTLYEGVWQHNKRIVAEEEVRPY